MTEMTKEQLLEWGNELLELCRINEGYIFDLEQKTKNAELTHLILDAYEDKFNKELMEYVTITGYGIVASEFFEKMRELYPYNSLSETKINEE